MSRLVRSPAAAAVTFGAAATVSCGALAALDVLPGVPTRAHDVVSSLPLLLVAAAFLAHQLRTRTPLGARVKAVFLSAAFVAWALYQLLPDVPHSVLFNDVAIVLFTLDIAVVVLLPSRWSGPDL